MKKILSALVLGSSLVIATLPFSKLETKENDSLNHQLYYSQLTRQKQYIPLQPDHNHRLKQRRFIPQPQILPEPPIFKEDYYRAPSPYLDPRGLC